MFLEIVYHSQTLSHPLIVPLFRTAWINAQGSGERQLPAPASGAGKFLWRNVQVVNGYPLPHVRIYPKGIAQVVVQVTGEIRARPSDSP